MKLKRFITNWLTHSAIAWVLVNLSDFFTYMFFPTEAPQDAQAIGAALWWRFVNHNFNQLVIVYILIFCLAVEINYQVLFKKMRTKLPGLAFGTIGIACSLVVLQIIDIMHRRYGPINPFTPTILQLPVFYILYTGFYIFLRDYFEGKKLRAQQKQQQTQAELNALKAQLNPHFFFNTLNTVYGTALQENAHKTAEVVDMLSNLTRYVMEKTTTDITTIGNEITFIENYFALQQLRLPQRDGIAVTSNITCANPALVIPPLLFIPFIENAFKYGISIDKPCFIYFTLTASNNSVIMQLNNSILANNNTQPGGGSGIANATKRLQLLYPGKHTLGINTHNSIFSVTLTINV